MFIISGCSTINKDDNKFIAAQICGENGKIVDFVSLNLIKGKVQSIEETNQIINLTMPNIRSNIVLVDCNSVVDSNSVMKVGNAKTLKSVVVGNTVELKKDFNSYNSVWSNWEEVPDLSNGTAIKIRFKSLPFKEYDSMPYLKERLWNNEK